MTDHKPMPVAGYNAQSNENVRLVNPEVDARWQLLDIYAANPEVDARWQLLDIYAAHQTG